MVLLPDKGLAIYTDGSCYHKDRRGGWAYLVLDAYGNEKTCQGWEDDSTISRMELSAALYGLIHMGLLYGPCEIFIFSDSEYVVLGATDRTRKRKINQDLWNLLDEAVDTHEFVEFRHVKGHADSEYNNRVDELANKARFMIT